MVASRREGMGVGTLEWSCEAVHDLGLCVEADAADTELRGADVVG